MLMEGVRLMIVGMLMVFAFLGLLVALMRASAVFFEAFANHFPEEASPGPAAAGAGRSEEIAVVLAVAEARRRGRDV